MSDQQASTQPRPRVRLLYDPAELAYDFGADHPLQAGRQIAMMDLLDITGLWRGSDRETALSLRPASIEELGLIHTPDYIAAVQRLSIPEKKELAAVGADVDAE